MRKWSLALWLPLLLSACPDSEASAPAPGHEVSASDASSEDSDFEAADAASETHASSRPSGGSRVSPASGSSGPKMDAGSTDEAACDADCQTDADCGGAKVCIRFAQGMKCAPAGCRDCETGCVFDLRNCAFTRCTADAPAGDGCGMACTSAADCGSGQVCADVFGIGECAPAECAGCGGFCDYAFDSCKFSACYVSTGAPGATDPDYCGHQF